MTERVDVAVRGGGIRLGQFLKLANAVDQGSDVKFLMAAGEVRVNGEVEVRRGRQLTDGDVVTFADTEYVVTARLTGDRAPGVGSSADRRAPSGETSADRAEGTRGSARQVPGLHGKFA